jgi:hypothetical protein
MALNTLQFVHHLFLTLMLLELLAVFLFIRDIRSGSYLKGFFLSALLLRIILLFFFSGPFPVIIYMIIPLLDLSFFIFIRREISISDC